MTGDTDILRAITEWRREEIEHLKPAPFYQGVMTAAQDRITELRKEVRGEDGTLYSCVMDEMDSIKTSIEDIAWHRTGKIVRIAVSEARIGGNDLYSKETLSEPDLKLNTTVRDAVTEYLREMGVDCEQN